MIRKSVLIADDDQMILRVLTVRCKHLGLEVRHAADAMQALTMIHKNPPDLVIMDLVMPAGDGLSVCQMLASDRRLKRIPIIILTGVKNDAIRARSQEMGVECIWKSPDCWDELRPMICRLLDIRSEAHDPDPGPSDPRYAARRRRAKKGAMTPGQLKRPLVLVIDDDSNVTQALDIRLEANGFGVICAGAGAEAYWLALEQRPDVITLDINMPQLDGLQLLRKLQSHDETRHIPVIVLTGMKDAGVESVFRKNKVYAFMTKPFSTKDVLETIRRALSRTTRR